MDGVQRSLCAAKNAWKSGNSNQPVDPVGNRKLLFDPAPHRARRGVDALCDLLNRVEFRRLRLIGFHFHHHPCPVPQRRGYVAMAWCPGHLSDFKSERSCKPGPTRAAIPSLTTPNIVQADLSGNQNWERYGNFYTGTSNHNNTDNRNRA
jgi:hypothetical protein